MFCCCRPCEAEGGGVDKEQSDAHNRGKEFLQTVFAEDTPKEITGQNTPSPSPFDAEEDLNLTLLSDICRVF